MTADAPGQVISGERWRTSAAIAENAARAASGFDAAGLKPGDAVALLLRNDIAFFEATTAASIIGAYSVPINWHFTAEEVAYILNDCHAKALVVHADLLAGIQAALPSNILLLAVETPPEVRAAYPLADHDVRQSGNVLTWEGWLQGFDPWPYPPRPLTSSVIYTSGTTGKPKGVVRPPMSEADKERAFAMVGAMYGFTPGAPIRTVLTGPMYHTAPNGYGLMAFRLGGTVVLQPRFDPLELLSLIERHRITHLHLVPTMFVRLLKLSDEDKKRWDLSSLRFVAHGAAPCPPQVKTAMIRWWGPVINEYYGSTETGGITVQSSDGALKKPGSVGKPIPGVEIRIYDDVGNRRGVGEMGNIYIRTTALADFTYLGKAEKKTEIERDAFVCLGDIGYFDKDEFLFLCDRQNDIINSGGVNIYSAEIEAALMAIPGVEDCAVFGIPDEEFGEAVCAHIVADPYMVLSEGKIKASLRTRLSGYKIPKVIVFADTLPREESGKIFKRKLRDLYWQDSKRRI